MAQYPIGKVSISDKGSYSGSVSYEPLDLVTNKGGAFLCREAASGIEPGVTSGWASYWTNVTKGIQSIALSSPSTGTARVTVTLSDGSTETLNFSTTAIAAGSVGTTELADNSVTDEKLNLAGGFTVDGAMKLTSGVGYGDSLPASGAEGQIFFLRVQ